MGPTPRGSVSGIQAHAVAARDPEVFLVVVILWGVQILMGVLTAHYGVEGHDFYRLSAG